MYRHSTPRQLAVADFYLPFGWYLSSESRWAKLAELIPWQEFEAEYAALMSEGVDAPVKSFRMASSHGQDNTGRLCAYS